MKLHDIKQSRQNKSKFKSFLLEPLKEGKKTRKELCDKYKKSDAHIRNEIRKIKLFYPVISYSSDKGYRVVDTEKVVKNGNLDLISKEREEIRHTINEINSRIKILKKELKPLIASDKVLARREEQLKEVSKFYESKK